MIDIDRSAETPPVALLERRRWDCEQTLSALHRIGFRKCYVCESPLAADFTVDHVKPIAHYPAGEYDFENLLLACGHCNGRKNDSVGFGIGPGDGVERRLLQELVCDGVGDARASFRARESHDAAAGQLAAELTRIHNPQGARTPLRTRGLLRQMKDHFFHEVLPLQTTVLAGRACGIPDAHSENLLRVMLMRPAPWCMLMRSLIHADLRDLVESVCD
jgi:hypothetical protein